MIGAIIVLIVISICSYWLGYYGSKINSKAVPVSRAVAHKNLVENYGGV